MPVIKIPDGLQADVRNLILGQPDNSVKLQFNAVSKLRKPSPHRQEDRHGVSNLGQSSRKDNSSQFGKNDEVDSDDDSLDVEKNAALKRVNSTNPDLVVADKRTKLHSQTGEIEVRLRSEQETSDLFRSKRPVLRRRAISTLNKENQDRSLKNSLNTVEQNSQNTENLNQTMNHAP